MHDSERRCWLDYQHRLPSAGLPQAIGHQYHERIAHILGAGTTATTSTVKVDRTFKVMTLNDLLRVAGL